MNRKQKFLVHFRWFLRYIPVNIFSFFSAPFIAPLAILMENPVFNPFWLWLDDGMYDEKRESGLAEDYERWLNGRKQTFWIKYVWFGFRNTFWNFKRFFFKKDAVYYAKTIYQNNMRMNDKFIFASRHDGELVKYNQPGLKWVGKDGTEHPQNFSGDEIGYKYSILGIIEMYFEDDKGRYYYRYMVCRKWAMMFGKQLWITFKYGTSEKRDLFIFKIQWEKN